MITCVFLLYFLILFILAPDSLSNSYRNLLLIFFLSNIPLFLCVYFCNVCIMHVLCILYVMYFCVIIIRVVIYVIQFKVVCFTFFQLKYYLYASKTKEN